MKYQNMLVTVLISVPLLSYAVPPAPTIEQENVPKKITSEDQNITKIKHLIDEILSSCNCDTSKLNGLSDFELGIATTFALLYQKPPENKETHEQDSDSEAKEIKNICVEKIVNQAHKLRNE